MSEPAERIRIGQLLLKAGILNEEQLDSQLSVAQTIGQPLGQILLQSGMITRYQLICAIQVQSMILDRVLTLDQGAEALRTVCVNDYDLGEACRQLGVNTDKAWTCKLGELLVRAGVIDARQLLDAIASSFQTSVPLGQTLVRSRKCRPDVIAAGLNLQTQVREGQIGVEEAVELLRQCHHQFAKSPTSSSVAAADPIEPMVKTPLEITGEFQAADLEQVDAIFWKRIRRQKLEEEGIDTSLEATAEELIGSVLSGRYEVISFIGSGGMSLVYLVRNRELEKVMALKMMQPRLRRDQEMIMRFKQEAQTVSSMDHPNIVAIHDFGVTDEGRFFLVMDYVPGMCLAELLVKEGRLAPERAIPILIQTCYAVAHAHARGIIHRDLKPSNIMLSTAEDQADIVKIVDFGIAKLQPPDGADDQKITRSGQLFGSPLYMSPERCMGRALDVRSDIYSMGCVIYEVFAGQPPFIGSTVYEIFYKHMQQKPPALGKIINDRKLSEAIDEVIATCLAKDPAKRYQSMAHVADALERISEHLVPFKPALAQPPASSAIGELLKSAGLLSADLLEKRLEVSRSIGQPLGQTLLQYSDLNELQLISVLQVQSLQRDKVLSSEETMTAIKVIFEQSLCLEEALEHLGMIDREGWTNRLGELLVSSKHITDSSLHKALYLALKDCRPLGHILVQEGMVKPVVVAKALSVQKRLREGLLSPDNGMLELKLNPTDETLFLQG